MKKSVFEISGMTCSSCSSHVERAVKKIDGIKNVNVNLLLNNMTVEYDESLANEEKIIASVIDARVWCDSKK
jgi:Cu+-exporting ATPase